jgi:hypothetical protein
MKTYREVRGADPFDWWEFLDKPEAEALIPMRIAQSLSGSWVTCACGNLCAIIPRDATGEPEDQKLMELGMDFHKAIRAMAAFSLGKSYSECITSYHRNYSDDDGPNQLELVEGFDNYDEARNLAILILLEIEDRSQELIDEMQGTALGDVIQSVIEHKTA